MSDDAISAIRKALEAGPTPGPWKHVTYMSGTQNVEYPGARGITFIDEVRDAETRSIFHESDAQPYPWLNISHRAEDAGNDAEPQRSRNAAFVAACNPSAIRALLAELDAARKDAERYRWLRLWPTHFATDNWGQYGAGLRTDQTFINTPERLDAVIDTAMNAEGKKG